MTDATPTIPADDPARSITVVDRDHPAAGWIALGGNTYTMLVTGEQTNGQYCLIDMLVPPGGGPGLHRHDFEEMFTVLDGEVEFTFRGERIRASEGSTVNIPANAPHRFENVSQRTARLLCMCTPAGQDEFFLRVAQAVDGPDARPAPPSAEQAQEQQARAARLAPEYRTELLG